MEKGPRKRAAAYARVSTLLGQDPEQQLILIRALASARDFDLVAEYSDKGVSGVRERRPGLDALVRDAKLGKFNVLIVTAIDRIGRSTKHILTLLDELKHYNVSLISISQGLDFSSPVGQMTLTVLSAVASLERELTRERIRNSLAAKKMAAELAGTDWKCGRPPKLTLEARQDIIRLSKQGLSIRQIKTALGGSLGTTSIATVLKRERNRE